MKSLFFSLFVCCIVLGCSTDAENNAIIDDPVVGQWRISAIHISSPTGPTIAPLDNEDIVIAFLDDGNFSGTTSVNSFAGRYTLDDDRLTMTEFATTEVADTAFGQAFYTAIEEAIVEGETFAEFVRTIEGNTLTLAFGDFRFLTLNRR